MKSIRFKMKVFSFMFVLIWTRNFCQLIFWSIDGLREFLTKISPKIDVFWIGEENSSESEKMIDRILSNKNDSLNFKVLFGELINATLITLNGKETDLQNDWHNKLEFRY